MNDRIGYLSQVDISLLGSDCEQRTRDHFAYRQQAEVTIDGPVMLVAIQNFRRIQGARGYRVSRSDTRLLAIFQCEWAFSICALAAMLVSD